MKKYNFFSIMIGLITAILFSLSITSCNDDDHVEKPNQKIAKLDVFGAKMIVGSGMSTNTRAYSSESSYSKITKDDEVVALRWITATNDTVKATDISKIFNVNDQYLIVSTFYDILNGRVDDEIPSNLNYCYLVNKENGSIKVLNGFSGYGETYNGDYSMNLITMDNGDNYFVFMKMLLYKFDIASATMTPVILGKPQSYERIDISDDGLVGVISNINDCGIYSLKDNRNNNLNKYITATKSTVFLSNDGKNLIAVGWNLSKYTAYKISFENGEIKSTVLCESEFTAEKPSMISELHVKDHKKHILLCTSTNSDYAVEYNETSNSFVKLSSEYNEFIVSNKNRGSFSDYIYRKNPDSKEMVFLNVLTNEKSSLKSDYTNCEIIDAIKSKDNKSLNCVGLPISQFISSNYVIGKFDENLEFEKIAEINANGSVSVDVIEF